MPGLVQPFATRCERGRGKGRVDSGYPYSNIPPHLPPISVAQFSLHVPLPCIFDAHARTAFFSHHFDSLGVGWSSAGHTDLDSEGIHMENIHPRILSRRREVMQAWDVTKGIHGDSKQPETGEMGSCCHSRLQNRREKGIARSQRGTTALVQISW